MLPRTRLLLLHQARGHELAGEGFQVLVRETLRREFLLELLLHILHRVLAVEHAEDEVLLAIKPVVPQTDRVLDDVEDLALILLLVRLKIRAHAEADAFAPLRRIVEGGREIHGSRSRDELSVFSDQLSVKSGP